MSIEYYVHGGGAVPVKTKRVFYRSGTANEGYAVCYNADAEGVTAENESVASGVIGFATALDGWCDARRLMVEDPTNVNALHFAGVVAKESNNVVGPNWITINVPGSVCKVYSAVTGTGVSSVSMNQMVTFAVGSGVPTATLKGMFTTGGLAGQGSAILLASGAAGLRMAQLLDGPPSGGVQHFAFTTAQADLSALICHGVARTSAGTTAAASFKWPTGRWVGQTLIAVVSTLSNNTTHLVFEGACYKQGIKSSVTVSFTVVTAFSMGTEAGSAYGVYDGRKWTVAVGTAVTT